MELVVLRSIRFSLPPTAIVLPCAISVFSRRYEDPSQEKGGSSCLSRMQLSTAEEAKA